MTKTDDELRREIMWKVREYWTTASGEPELGEFADYLISVIRSRERAAGARELRYAYVDNDGTIYVKVKGGFIEQYDRIAELEREQS